MTYQLTGLDGKVAVVSGAGRMRSIGRPIAVELARAGCDVVLTGTGRSPSDYPSDEQEAGWRDIESVAEEVRALGHRALTLVVDISDHAAVTSMAQQALAEFGRVDVLINNAAASRGADRVPVVDLDTALLERVINVNLNGTFAMSKVFAQQLITQGAGGSIINISSIAGKLAAANSAAYSASKAAIHALTAAMAKEVGPRGVRVNSILPGMIDTSRLDDMRDSGRWDAVVKANIPLGRAGTGTDIAAMAVFLCSDQGSWITGQQISVDGGHVALSW